VGDFDALADSGWREDRFQALLDAVSTLVADTDVATVVRTIVDSAAGLVDADYGVCALLGPDGDLTDLVHRDGLVGR